MMGRRGCVVQVVPPGSGGVHDYAICLAEAWAAVGITARVVEAPAAVGRARALVDLLERTARQLPSPPHILVHFSGYGYARRGLCFWLADACRDIKAQVPIFSSLAVMFHELYATSAPWRSAFWLNPAQRRIAASLALDADLRVTNTDRHAHWLMRIGAPVADVWPVFSNVGETARPRPFADRDDVVLVFGGSGSRQRVGALLQRAPRLLEALGRRPLIEVGPGAAAVVPLWPHPQARHAGLLAVAQAAELLAASRRALIDYPGRHLAKSGVFAAYAAHGTAVINLCQDLTPADGLAPGRHYLAAPAWVPDEPRDAAVAAELHRWYQGHRLLNQAAAWLDELADQAQATRRRGRAD